MRCRGAGKIAPSAPGTRRDEAGGGARAPGGEVGIVAEGGGKEGGGGRRTAAMLHEARGVDTRPGRATATGSAARGDLRRTVVEILARVEHRWRLRPSRRAETSGKGAMILPDGRDRAWGVRHARLNIAGVKSPGGRSKAACAPRFSGAPELRRWRCACALFLWACGFVVGHAVAVAQCERSGGPRAALVRRVECRV